MITVTKYDAEDAEVNRTASASRCQQLTAGIKVTRMIPGYKEIVHEQDSR